MAEIRWTGLIPIGFYGYGHDAAIPDDTALSWEEWEDKVEAALKETTDTQAE